MHDILSLHPRGFGAADAERLYALPHVRAVAHSRFGSGTGAVVLARVASFESLTTTRSADLCLDPATCGVLVPQLPFKYPSTFPPAMYNVLALVTVAGGVQRGYSAHLRCLDGAAKDVKEAGALVLGLEEVHFLLEVVGDDLTAVTNRLLTLTDHGDVVGVRSFVVPAAHTYGFGVEMADKPGTAPQKKAARKGAGRAARS